MEKYLGTITGVFGKTPEETAHIEQFSEAIRDALEPISKIWWSCTTAGERKEKVQTALAENGT